MHDSSDSSDGERDFKFYYYLSEEDEEEDEDSDEEKTPDSDSDSSPKQVKNMLEMPPDAAAAADSEMYDLSKQEQKVGGDVDVEVEVGVEVDVEVEGGEGGGGGEGEEGEEDFEYSEEEKTTPIPGYWFSTEVRNWVEEMPPDVMSLIFTKVGPIDILLGPQFVCTAWQKLSKQPHFYRSIDLRNRDDMYYSHDERSKNYDPERLVKLAVHRSAGQLVEFSVQHVGTDAMLRSITEIRSPLKCVRLVECGSIDEYELMVMAKKLPLLEELEILHCYCNKSMIIGFGRYCPQLKSFRLTCTPERFCEKSNGQAFSIARNMPGLHHLDLFGNPLSDTGLIVILDQCLHLKSLDCRRCFRQTFGEDLFKRCTDRNIDVKLPNDCTVGCGFDTSDCDRELTIYDFREDFD